MAKDIHAPANPTFKRKLHGSLPSLRNARCYFQGPWKDIFTSRPEILSSRSIKNLYQKFPAVMHPPELATSSHRSDEDPEMNDLAKTAMTRRLFIKRSGGVTVAAAVAPLGLPSDILKGYHRVVSYQYRLFVSGAPDQDDFIVGWMTNSDRVEWKLLGVGPQPNDTSYSGLKPIVGAITSPFAKATGKSTPQLKRGEDLYDGSWLSAREIRETPPKLHFLHESKVEMAPEDKSSSLKVEKTVIEAKLSRRVFTSSITSTGGSEKAVKWATEDGREFPSQAAAEAHVQTHGDANIPALKIVSTLTGGKEDELGGRFLSGEETVNRYTKSTDGQGRLKLEQSAEIERRASGLASVVWKIEVQRRRRSEQKKKGGDVATEYSEWKAVEQSPDERAAAD